MERRSEIIHRRSNERNDDGVQFWTLRKLFFFQNHRSCRSVAALRKLIRRPLFPPPLIECRGETNDTELSFESSLLGICVTPLFIFSLICVLSFFLFFLLLSYPHTPFLSLSLSLSCTLILFLPFPSYSRSCCLSRLHRIFKAA